MDTTVGLGKIVVGVDGSPGSRSALSWAFGEAALHHTEIEAVFAWEIPALAYGAPGFAPPAVEEMERLARQTVDEMLVGLPSDHDVKIHVEAPEGRAVDVLRRAVRAPDVGLVVVGSRGHGEVAEMFLGSVSHGLSHHCPKPLVIIPKGCAEDSSPMTGGRIVVGVDGGSEADSALRWAAAEATARDAALEVVMVAWSPTIFPSKTPYPGSLNAALKDEAAQIVQAAIGRLEPTGARIESRTMEGAAAQVLVSEAANAQLLVVGSRGRGRAREAMSGSVSHWCAHRTHTPIVIVPAGGAWPSALVNE